MKNQKGFVIPIIIAIVAVIATGGAFFVIQKKEVKVPVIDHSYKSSTYSQEEQTQARERALRTIVIDETKDWKTYTNNKYGVEFQYPVGWKINILMEEGVGDVIQLLNPESTSSVPFAVRVVSNKDYKSNLDGKNIILSGKKAVDSGWKNSSVGDYPLRLIKVFSEPLINIEMGIFSFTTKKIEEKILSTFKFISTTTPSCESKTDSQPIITSISTTSSQIGKILEINGCNLSGFEGDLDVVFEKTNGQKIVLTDTFSSYIKTGDKLIKVKIEEPCQKGEKIIGRYSGIENVCDYVELTPGLYKVYVEPWGRKSNVIDFNITPDLADNITNETKDWKTYRNEEYEFEFKYPSAYKDFSFSSPVILHKKEIYINHGSKYDFIDYRSEAFPLTTETISDNNTDDYSGIVSMSVFNLKTFGFSDIPGGSEYGYDLNNHVWWKNNFDPDTSKLTGKTKIKLENTFVSRFNGNVFYSTDGQSSNKIVLIPNEQKGLMIEFVFTNDSLIENITLQETIFSTFKFTK